MDSTASRLRIAQRACIEMGAKVITSFGEAGTGTIISSVYDDCRQEFLEEHPWSFATQTLQLSTLSTVPLNFGDGALIAYAVPALYLSVYKINFPTAQIYQQILNGQNVIVSDTAGLIVKAVIDNDDPTTYSAKARLALALKIASTCCFKVVEAAPNAAMLLARYEKILMSAIADDSKGSTPDQIQADNIFFQRLAGANASVGSPGNNQNIGFFPTGWGG